MEQNGVATHNFIETKTAFIKQNTHTKNTTELNTNWLSTYYAQQNFVVVVLQFFYTCYIHR